MGGATLAAHAPLDAFRVWFHTLADYVRVKHGLGEALNTAAARDAINATYAPVVGAVSTLLDACVADGSMRDGLDRATCCCSWDSCGGCPTGRTGAGRPTA